MIVNLGTSLNLAMVGELKTALLAALATDEAVSLEAGGLTEVDVSGLQLLCATHRSATAQHKQVTFVPGPRAALASAAAAAGFLPGRGCPADCLCARAGGE